MPRRSTPQPLPDDFREHLELLDLATLRPHPRNDGQHPPSEIAHLKASLDEHGIYRNIVVAQDGTYLAGHGIGQAALESGRTHFPGYRMPYAPDDPRALKLLVGANHIARLRVQDDAMLTALLQDLAQDDPLALLGTGFDEATLAALAEAQGLGAAGGEQAGRDVEPQIDRAEELREVWGTEVGQLLQAGQHRIICSDCTDKAVVERLLGATIPAILINDPPYGMRLDADFSSMTSNLKFARTKKAFGGSWYPQVHGDDHDFDASRVLAVLPDVPEQFWFGADFYASSLGDTQHEGAWLVWDKRLDEVMDRMYGTCFELIWSRRKHKRDILRHKWAGIFGMEHEPQRRRSHPNQKPVILIEDLLTRYSDAGALVMDGFLGSGTTLIACENLKRRCFGCEIDPGYVAVTLQRWADLTGEKPILLEH